MDQITVVLLAISLVGTATVFVTARRALAGRDLDVRLQGRASPEPIVALAQAPRSAP